MTKYFCDNCGSELCGHDKGDQVTVVSGRWTFNISHALDGVWNSRLVCRKCVLDLLASKRLAPPAAKGAKKR